MKKVLIVFGTRPEAIKMAPLVKAFSKYNNEFEMKVCVTAQHREMLDQVLELFNIVPDYDLDIMTSEQDLFDITANVLLGMKKVFNHFNPDIVLVHGDTTTTIAASLAALYFKIKVGHIEAGLRTNNLLSPWPEEANRQLTSVIADYHFVPTSEAKDNLLKENKNNIFITGNTVIDALFLILEEIEKNNTFRHTILTKIQISYNMRDDKKIILVTGHRRENFGKRFEEICKALKQIALDNPSLDIIYPVHLNPNVQKPVNKLLSDVSNIYLLKPLSYEVFVYLMSKSYFIITDSGGIQEEASSLNKPVLLMRENTERPESLKTGGVKLVGTNINNIIKNAQELLDDDIVYSKMSHARNPYGDGSSSHKIIKLLI